MDSVLLDDAKAAVRLALKKGAQGAQAGVARARNVSVDWRDGKLEKISEASTRGMSVALYVDGRYSAVSTSDLRPEALDRFLGEAVAMARVLAPDPMRQLPDPRLYEGQADLDLELSDPEYDSVTAQERRSLAEQIEAAARTAPGGSAIISVTSSFADTSYESASATSNGFTGTRRATVFSAGAEASVMDPDGRRPEESHYVASRFFKQLPDLEEVGRVAALRALGRIGSQKMESAVLPMVVENRVAGSILGRLMGSLSAASLQQKRSFLDGKKGEAVGSPLLNVADDPLVVRGMGSRLFDGEGIAARRMPIFEDGVLQNYYVDTYYGRKLGIAPTTGGSSNLSWRIGDRSLDQLLAEVGEGLLVTGFLGGNSNGTTGDFSLGVQGFAIRAGKRAEPVAEINIAGNHLELWKRLSAVGNDPYPFSSGRTPTLVFDGVQLAGM